MGRLIILTIIMYTLIIFGESAAATTAGVYEDVAGARAAVQAAAYD